MDIIFIRDLSIETTIGVYEWERGIRQTIVLDLELGTDVRRSAASGALEDALDYMAVATRLGAYVGGERWELVETLAERIAELLITEFHVPWLRLTLTKPAAVRGARAVGVRIERSAAGG
ncbi:MAG TPA: dihydroneopterin aldolase [Plasticicumulans sp.]|uniref:dihydroneopterin aldolase n=1 Tax=Plasticicumulans sp. TaxID=2307179 RepID=UPI002CC437A5|nr:dihydroneopterin aldolase [Plasticicumulans sp.]HMW30876.1 dihydroneopterin aldolase [Plasticicumulans sp.]HMW42630.1 dihydroneopterin aldolase [Plasticicumulans sp.]HMX53561.1 dihydroneopterin aldolase [Plasticicumulans sp.]HMZ11134.1 dihydroneopterin aldolase [Plasticicumulans sp.]HNG50050.1 dihydroneopterin aldolase [Plasticicumulans sp.]